MRLEIGRLDVGDEAPLETRPQPFLERRNLVRRAVAAEDDLFLRVVERVEGVEELGLRAFLAGEELDVVNEQHVDRPIAFAKVEDAVVAHGVDHLVHEPLGRDVGEFQMPIVLQHVVADGVHQMRLSETHAAVDEQRVVRARGCFGDSAARGMGELIGWPDDEGVEECSGDSGRHRREWWGRDGNLENRGFLITERDIGRISLLVGDEHDLHARTGEFRQCFADDTGVVLGQPILEKAVGNPDREAVGVLRDEARRLKPGIEAVPIHLCFDSGEDLFPEVFINANRSKRLLQSRWSPQAHANRDQLQRCR